MINERAAATWQGLSNVQGVGALFGAYRCGRDWSEAGTTEHASVEVGTFAAAEGGALFTGGCTVHGRGGTRQRMILSDCFRWAEGGREWEGDGREGMEGDGREGMEGDDEVHG